MQFQVPQFLDVEDKIIGPFTIKQFLYLGGGLGLGYLSFGFIPFIGLLLGALAVGFGAALAFYKYNNKPLVFLLNSIFNYAQSARFYVWKRKEKKQETQLDLNNFTPTRHESGLSTKMVSSKLSDLAWSMDVSPEESARQKHSDKLEV